jgi:nucleoside-diphosphate-sugar epimerase
MGKEVLVLGGTRFVGPSLVCRLVSDGSNVTIATRGETGDTFGEQVRRQTIDRRDPEDLKKLARLRAWDLIYDQICYSAFDAEISCNAFAGRVGRYVLTSSSVVYDSGPGRPEADFNARAFRTELPSAKGKLETHNYAIGKRSAEAVFAQNGCFPYVAVRFPNILGENDSSRRLEWHVERIRHGTPIFVPDRKVRQSLVWSEDAARFLAWIGDQAYCGPINAASKQPIAIGELAAMVATELNTEVVYSTTMSETNVSPFAFIEELSLAVDLAEGLGFRFADILDWLAMVIRKQIISGPRLSRDPDLHKILLKLHQHVEITSEEFNYLRRALARMEHAVPEPSRQP